MKHGAYSKYFATGKIAAGQQFSSDGSSRWQVDVEVIGLWVLK